MKEGKQFKTISQFRRDATSEDLEELESYILALPKRVEAFPNERYNFSYSAAASYLKSLGYLGGDSKKKDREATEEQPARVFVLGDGDQLVDTVSRSAVINRQVIERLDRLSADNWQYSKRLILNKVISEGLKIYGY